MSTVQLSLSGSLRLVPMMFRKNQVFTAICIIITWKEFLFQSFLRRFSKQEKASIHVFQIIKPDKRILLGAHSAGRSTLGIWVIMQLVDHSTTLFSSSSAGKSNNRYVRLFNVT